jgi:hypothetical protein
MPYIALIIGLFLVIVGYKGTQGDLVALLKDDFTGPNNFLRWVLAIAIVGSLGYIKPLRPIANSILALLIIVMFLTNGGFFDKLSATYKQVIQ